MNVHARLCMNRECESPTSVRVTRTYPKFPHTFRLMPQSKRICIIGAGPTGLAALQAVLESPQYSSGLWEPVLFEQKANVGGVWCSIMSSTLL